jgi:hypothetical protein
VSLSPTPIVSPFTGLWDGLEKQKGSATWSFLGGKHYLWHSGPASRGGLDIATARRGRGRRASDAGANSPLRAGMEAKTVLFPLHLYYGTYTLRKAVFGAVF